MVGGSFIAGSLPAGGAATSGAVTGLATTASLPTSAGAASSFLSTLFSIISPVNLAAFLGALGSGALVTFLAFTKAGRRSTVMLLLCGTAL